MSSLESVQSIATQNSINIYTQYKRGIFPAEDILKGVVEFVPPIPEQTLKNEVLAWILLDPTQRKFVSYQADEQGLVSCVTHVLRKPKCNFRNRADLMDYYFENGGKWQLEE